MSLLLDEATRAELYARLAAAIEHYQRHGPEGRVSPVLDPEGLRARLEPFDFARPIAPLAALDFAVTALTQHQVHTPHPMYYGLYNPAPATMGVVADALVAAWNPQLASWSHSPLGVELELHLLRALGGRFGYDPQTMDGTFTSGGAEANHSALLLALTDRFPDFARGGVRALARPPVFYVSAESHHSLLKAARLCGLGTDAVREVKTDAELRMDPAALAARIARDRAEGAAPFLVVATAGTTSAGAVDPIEAIADIAAAEGLWCHVDAAWGGAAALVPELRPLVAGAARADSITFDAHKWLSVPMAAGMLLTRHRDILGRTFRVTADYMPRETAELDIVDPYAHSMQWSRRFIGLKVFLALAVAGWGGYEEVLRHQVAMGDELRRALRADGWEVVNRTPLPVVCFVDSTRGASAAYLEALCRHVVGSGRAWISTARLGAERTPALRACITNYRTEAAHVAALVEALGEARDRVAEGTKA
jgi:glutamate/tyrosine decarboxylase-like PLP-dependent enzyme